MRVAIAAALVVVCGCGGREDVASADGSTSIDAPACEPSVPLPDPSPSPSEHADCLADTSTFDASWELKDDAWCIVARYDMPATVSPGHTLTWGRHGGPLQGGPTIVRWSPPAGPTGTMTSRSEEVHATLPDGAQWTDWATDLPFDDWTAIGMLETGATTSGAQIWFLHDGNVERRMLLDSSAPYVPVGLVERGETRFVLERLDLAIESSPYTTSIEAVDDCRAEACASPLVLEAPLLNQQRPIGMFADASSTVFAAFSEARGIPGQFEHVRGYGRTRIAPGACPTTGVDAQIYGNILPAADGERVYYGAQDYDRGIDTIAYHLDGSGAVAFDGYASFVVPRVPFSGWYFGALLFDDHGRLWAANVVDKTVTFWIFARR